MNGPVDGESRWLERETSVVWMWMWMWLAEGSCTHRLVSLQIEYPGSQLEPASKTLARLGLNVEHARFRLGHPCARPPGLSSALFRITSTRYVARAKQERRFRFHLSASDAQINDHSLRSALTKRPKFVSSK